MSEQQTVTQVEPDSWKRVHLVRDKRGKGASLRLGTAVVFFYDLVPVGVLSGHVLQFNCQPGAQQRYINQAVLKYTNVVAVRADPSQFDFVLGSTFTQVGLPLTTRTR